MGVEVGVGGGGGHGTCHFETDQQAYMHVRALAQETAQSVRICVIKQALEGAGAEQQGGGGGGFGARLIALKASVACRSLRFRVLTTKRASVKAAS